MTTKASAILVKSKSQLITRAQLARFPKPKATGPHHLPVPHIELIETLEKRLKEKFGAKIISEQYATRREGATLFGVMTLNYGKEKDVTGAIGLRHANDRTMAMQFVAGLSVFVCDNLSFRGDVIFMRKRHTTNLELAAEIDEGLDKFEQHFTQLISDVKVLKGYKISDEEAKAVMFDAFAKDEVMPVQYMRAVAGEYFKPRHAEFAPRTKWSLHNAFTEVAKKLPMTSRMTMTQHIGKLFGLIEKK